MAPTASPDDAPASLAAAESAFAAQSVREGMKAAFLSWLAPGATMFRDGPVDGPALVAGRPDPPIVLDWRPAFVEVAASGELGLSTGPWKLASRQDPAAAPHHGQFVSVWKREAQGPWRVHIDLGIEHVGAALADAPLLARTTPAAGRPGAGTIAQAEAAFASRAAADGDGAAYAAFASPGIRLYRNGFPPYLGREPALASPAAGSARTAWTLDRHGVAASGDLGYAVGRLGPAPGVAAGDFVRIWRREAEGWRIAADVVDARGKR
jgi:ketosteroid isomerase-like protein